MEGFELIQKAKEGDFTALQEWMNIHSEKIERFAFQYGLSLESALQVTVDTFVAFRKELENIDEERPLLSILYKIELEKLLLLQVPTTVPNEAFPFKEDADLHSTIVLLDVKYRIPFILSSFHGLSETQIATIIGCSPYEIEENIQTAKRFLNGNQLEKRVEFLEKSYARLPVLFNAEQIMGGTASFEIKKEKINSAKWFIAASILLIGLLTITFFSSNERETVKITTNDYEVKYKEERDKRQEMLQLTDERFNKLNFIKSADERIKAMINLHLSDEEMEVEIEKIMNDLKLPFEMIEDVVNNPVTEDEGASIAYLSLYRDKVNDLINIYKGVLWDYRAEIESYDVDRPEQKVELLMLSRNNNFSEEFQNVIDTIRDNSIRLCADRSTGGVRVCYYDSALHKDMQDQYHPHTKGYVNMMVYEHYDLSMEFALYIVIDHLREIQRTLASVQRDPNLYPVLESHFVTLLYNFIKGTEVFDEQGIVFDTYQKALGRIASYDDATSIDYLISPIVEEMETSEWRSSASWEEFNPAKIVEALKLARGGELEEMMYGKRMIVVGDSIALPDVMFENEVKQRYNDFKQSYDITIFKNVSPTILVGVFDYAREMEDPETMFHLFHEDVETHLDSGSVESKETYVENWRNGLPLFEAALKIEFVAEDIMRFGNNHYVDVKITYGAYDERYVGAWLEKDGIWRIGRRR